MILFATERCVAGHQTRLFAPTRARTEAFSLTKGTVEAAYAAFAVQLDVQGRPARIMRRLRTDCRDFRTQDRDSKSFVPQVTSTEASAAAARVPCACGYDCDDTASSEAAMHTSAVAYAMPPWVAEGLCGHVVPVAPSGLRMYRSKRPRTQHPAHAGCCCQALAVRARPGTGQVRFVSRTRHQRGGLEGGRRKKRGGWKGRCTEGDRGGLMSPCLTEADSQAGRAWPHTASVALHFTWPLSQGQGASAALSSALLRAFPMPFPGADRASGGAGPQRPASRFPERVQARMP